MAYGVDQYGAFQRTAYYVDRILKGAKPEELPVEQPTKLELVINMKTAKNLGIRCSRARFPSSLCSAFASV
jgi:putative ABC transport system substrate-binding protein